MIKMEIQSAFLEEKKKVAFNHGFQEGRAHKTEKDPWNDFESNYPLFIREMMHEIIKHEYPEYLKLNNNQKAEFEEALEEELHTSFVDGYHQGLESEFN